MKYDARKRDKAIKAIEKDHPFQVTALLDDGGAFLLPVLGDKPMGTPFAITYKKLLKLAAVGPMPA